MGGPYSIRCLMIMIAIARATIIVFLLGGALPAETVRPRAASSSGFTLVGWSDPGMHCIDADYSVFCILPPYNTIHAQLIDPSGSLVKTSDGISVTYQAIQDAAASINTTSQGKTNFWQYVQTLYGAAPMPDTGLAGNSMPGVRNAPQPMAFDAAWNWFSAAGIPLTSYDDGQHKNSYPMMRLVASDSTGTVLATTDIVLPVSDEKDCRTCHASGSGSAARPAEGWINDPNSERDYRLNILLLHDDLQGGGDPYQKALLKAGYNSGGLFATLIVGQKPVFCAACHGSNTLAGTGMDGIPPLTQSMHAFHASVADPATGLRLDLTDNRSACYRCHAGSTTPWLRGVMGSATAPDGSIAMQCQSCHGSMSRVGADTRQGWLQEPTCQNCHTGTATTNSGQIRFTSVFDDSGEPRQAADLTFAANPDAPAPGLSLYRFSSGHGGLRCAACHGATHAELPSAQDSDNAQSIELQGHTGVIAECSACHVSVPNTVKGGPHGLHPFGQAWVNNHHNTPTARDFTCYRPCHGSQAWGTVLSQTQSDRVFNAGPLGTRSFPKGHQISCNDCH